MGYFQRAELERLYLADGLYTLHDWHVRCVSRAQPGAWLQACVAPVTQARVTYEGKHCPAAWTGVVRSTVMIKQSKLLHAQLTSAITRHVLRSDISIRTGSAELVALFVGSQSTPHAPDTLACNRNFLFISRRRIKVAVWYACAHENIY